MTKYMMLSINILFLVIGQCLWKYGIMKLSVFSIYNIFSSVYIWLGVVLYVMATILWLRVLFEMPLSVAYPMQSVAYLLGIIVSIMFFNESFSLSKIVGGILIMIGIFFIAGAE